MHLGPEPTWSVPDCAHRWRLERSPERHRWRARADGGCGAARTRDLVSRLWRDQEGLGAAWSDLAVDRPEPVRVPAIAAWLSVEARRRRRLIGSDAGTTAYSHQSCCAPRAATKRQRPAQVGSGRLSFVSRCRSPAKSPDRLRLSRHVIDHACRAADSKGRRRFFTMRGNTSPIDLAIEAMSDRKIPGPIPNSRSCRDKHVNDRRATVAAAPRLGSLVRSWPPGARARRAVGEPRARTLQLPLYP